MINQLDFDEIKLFLSESNRIKEEKFLRSITDNYKNKLQFSQNTCTDGDIVYVCPNHPYVKNFSAVKKVAEQMNMHINSTWLLLKLFTRGGIAHEAFHILFTNFKILKKMEKEFADKHLYKKQIIHHINNIIEDAFIELAGINYLNGLETYIEFSNQLAFENMPSLDEMEEKCKNKQLPWINLFLHWAMMYAIVGKIKGKIKSRKINSKIKEAKPILDKARLERDSNKRYQYSKEVFKIVEDLIDEAIEQSNMVDFQYFKNSMPNLDEGMNVDVDIKKDFNSRQRKEQKKENKEKKKNKQNEQDKVENDDINNKNGNKNKNQINEKTNKESEEKIQKRRQEEQKRLLKELEKEKENVRKDENNRKKQEKMEEEENKKLDRELSKVKYSDLHRDIRIITNREFPHINDKEKKYEHIYNINKKTIKRFSKILKKLIENQRESWTRKQYIGTRINTRHLADPKRRVWEKKKEKRQVADLSIMLLVDGSGSMINKLSGVINATVIIYEVAKELNIPICIVEERAICGEPVVVHNILVDYKNFKKTDVKYNLLHIKADDNTREGVSLKWASTYQSLQPQKDKLLIVLADGKPEHYGYQKYIGNISASDTKKVAEEVERQGTNIVAISLGRNCYESLKQIYPKTILCENLAKLPEQMIQILKQNIFK